VSESAFAPADIEEFEFNWDFSGAYYYPAWRIFKDK
jgi:hypothetical protein